MTTALDTVRWMLKRVPGVPPAIRLARALATPLERGRLRAELRGARLFQTVTVTRADRHPVLFELVRAHLADHTTPRLLSFGCSTGEEVFTLGRYLPDAAIDGIDANPVCIARAQHAANRSKRRSSSATIRFVCADSPDAVAPARYDAILCLSVLRDARLDAREPDRCAAFLPFDRFADAVAALDRRLETGGILLLWGCNFRFTDTPTASRYRIVPTPTMRAQQGPFYGCDDHILAAPSYPAFAFVKVS